MIDDFLFIFNKLDYRVVLQIITSTLRDQLIMNKNL